MSAQVGLGRGAEFDAIRSMVARWGPLARGIGDDASIVDVPRGDKLVVSVDTSIEGRHFRREWLAPTDIGYRAVVAALSDLAAMAARPLGILVAIAVPTAWRDTLLEISDGIGQALEEHRTVILGGNLSDAGELSITTTVLGATYAPLSRSGATVGDRVFVTGTLGGSGAVLAALVGGRQPDATAFAAFKRPTARLDEAFWLAEQGASAMIDISDGLTADLSHLAAASDVSIAIDAERVPVVKGMDVREAIASGEEYELLITSPHDLDGAEFSRRFRIPLTEIGVVTSREDKEHLVLRMNGERVANPSGHDHFSR